MPISSLSFALFLTIIIECPIAYAMGLRKSYQVYIIALVNVITNPALNYVIMLLRMAGLYSSSCLLVLEIAVVLIEWMVMSYAFKADRMKLLVLSIVMNGASYFIGAWIQSIY